MRPDVQLRPLRLADSISELTSLLHRAYAPLAVRGMRYLASHQDDAMTARRATSPGHECTLAVLEGRMVGTITLAHPGCGRGTEWYRRPDVAYFGQFAVDPACQRYGIGELLLDWAEDRARELGALELACDTSDRADDLIRMYSARGYREVERVQWEVTNYPSVVLSKGLAPKPDAAAL